jgi:hypothetical protein
VKLAVLETGGKGKEAVAFLSKSSAKNFYLSAAGCVEIPRIKLLKIFCGAFL